MQLVDLTGKRILVTGASSGIGRACALTAAELGATLVLTGRRNNALEQTEEACSGASHSVVVGDVADAGFIKELVIKSGPFDGLIHAAGVCPAIPVGMVDQLVLLDSMRVNYFAFMELMRYCSKAKHSNKGFSAVAVSSVSSEAGWAGGAVYSGSKGALSAAIRSLAIELAPKGIRVNAVCPSNIRTPMFEALAGNLNDEAGLRRLEARQPLGIGDPRQVASVVCFLLSSAASFVTGVNLPVDGGYLAQ